MVPETKPQPYRGVVCFRCKHPIRLPEKILARAAERPDDERSFVFTLRCRACCKEGIYQASHFVEFA